MYQVRIENFETGEEYQVSKHQHILHAIDAAQEAIKCAATERVSFSVWKKARGRMLRKVWEP